MALLFAVLGLWHGGKSSDLIFACFSTVFTLSSRALSQNNYFRNKIINLLFWRECIRFISLSLFGVVLGIYDFRNQIIVVDNNISSLYLPFLISIFIYIYYRLKIMFSESNKINGNYKNFDIYISCGEIIAIIFINLFLLLDLEQINEFIYFAR